MTGYSNEHFWQVSFGNYVGFIHIQVSDNANECEVKKQVLEKFDALGFKTVVVQVDKIF